MPPDTGPLTLLEDAPILNPLARLHLLDDHRDPAYDRLMALACNLLAVPQGAVSIIDEAQDRQFFKSFAGLPPALSEARQTALSHSLCRIVRDTNQPLVIGHASADPGFKTHPAHTDLGIEAYLGQPIHLPCGTPIGALCVFSMDPRAWDATEVNHLAALAACIDETIQGVAANQDAVAARQDASRALAARQYFLAGLDHEVRTSLNGVLGLATALGDMPLDEGAASLVQELLMSGERLHGLLAALLNHTEASSQTARGPVQQKSVREALNEVLSVFRSVTTEHRHRFSVVVNSDRDQISVFDTCRIKQILYDLVANAIATSPRGASEIQVVFKGRDELTLRMRVHRAPQERGDAGDELANLDWSDARRLIEVAGGLFDVRVQTPQCVQLSARIPLLSH